METISNKVNENQVIGRKFFQYKKVLVFPNQDPLKTPSLSLTQKEISFFIFQKLLLWKVIDT